MKPPKVEEYHRKAGEEWAKSIEGMGVGGQASTTWEGLNAIQDALLPIMGQGNNHAHFPTGGGLDFLSIGLSGEKDCLEAKTDVRLAEVFKPEALILESFPEHPHESFFLLKLQPLAPTGVYEQVVEGQEELLDVPGKGYLRREVWDRGFIGIDEQGCEIAIPQNARLISRWLGGSILFVAKGSLWNSNPGTYDGRHSRMTAAQIRGVIERSLPPT